MDKLVIIIFFAFSGFNLQGQSIIGKVLDSKTLEALPFANVFLNNTTIGTTTDTNGDFRLNSIKEPGAFEIVFSFVGYESYKTKVNVGDGILNMGTIRLKPSEIELNTVEVKGTRDKEWEKKLKRFKKIFLGEDKLSASCTILNPWVIDFPVDRNGNRFIAKANAPIEIQNEALGYKMVFYLSNFWSDGTGYSITGNAQFTELKSVDTEVLEKWLENRKRSYQHSTHHLFKSIIDKRIYGEGFNLYTEVDAYKNTYSRSSEFYSELGKTVIPYDTIGLVIPDKEKGVYRINLKGRVEVHYRKEKAPVRVYRDVFGPVSWIRLNKDFVIVNEDGFAKNPTDVVVSGDMSSGRVASMLPLDYKPLVITDAVDRINFSMYQEQMYVHTDKPYYYPGETIWFKGYVNYATPAWRDSLSRTVYVELVDRETKAIVRSKTLEITNGVFDNEFRLSDTLAAKMYYLRAYTNFNRNFGDENIYVKPLPVLNITDKVSINNQLMQEETGEGSLIFSADKSAYKPREKITLSLKLVDENNEPVSGNLSVTVVDSMQVAPVKISGTIVEDYPLKEIPVNRINKELPFQIEYGINFSGRFLNESDKPEKAMLNILKLNPNYFLMAQSDEDGIFEVSGLSFYDTAVFSVQSNRGKNAYGHGEWVKSTPASIDFKEYDHHVEIIKTDLTQRILSEYEAPKGTRLLQEVVVKSTKIEDEYKGEYRIKRSYGKPDHVIKRSDLNLTYGNLLLAMPGKVPGLTVRQSYSEGQGMRWVVYVERGKNSSISNAKEVIVTVNDVLMSGTPEEILSNIDPAIVETIEVKKGINVLYGSLGGSGIVSIYTKKDFQQNESTKSMSMMRVPGYARVREFTAPDYSDPQTDTTQADYRSTIYWNPEVITDAKTGVATFSFFATDLTGKYRIVAEGITRNGEPVRGTYLIVVDSK